MSANPEREAQFFQQTRRCSLHWMVGAEVYRGNREFEPLNWIVCYYWKNWNKTYQSQRLWIMCLGMQSGWMWPVETGRERLTRNDDVGHTKQVKITLSVNGEVRQQGELSDIFWSVPQVISSLSRLFELYPVDLIFTGTPVGVRQMNLCDRLEGEVENLAKLKITILQK